VQQRCKKLGMQAAIVKKYRAPGPMKKSGCFLPLHKRTKQPL